MNLELPVLRVVETLTNIMNSRKATVIMYPDIIRAFDRVFYENLASKMVSIEYR